MRADLRTRDLRTTDLRTTAADISARIETVFEEVATTLFELLDEVRGVAGDMTALTRLSGQQGRDELRKMVAHIGQVLEQFDDRLDVLIASTDQLHANANTLRTLLHEQTADLQMASMVSTNARVVSSGIPESDGALEQFAEDVRRLLDEGSEHIEGIVAQLLTADGRLSRLVVELRSLTSRASMVMSIRHRLVGLVDALSNEEIEIAAVRTGRDMGSISRTLETTVNHLQVGDSSRQRFDHVVEIMDAAAARSGDEAAVLRDLALAQHIAAHRTMQQSGYQILMYLRRMDDRWSSVLDTVSALSGSEAMNRVTGIMAPLNDIADGLSDLDAKLEALEPELHNFIELYGSVAALVRNTTGLNQEMSLLGINAILVSGRIGDRGLAMMEVSRQLRESTAHIGQQSQKIADLASRQQQHTRTIREVSVARKELDLAGALAPLQTRLTDLGDTLDQINKAFAAIASGRGFAPSRARMEEFFAAVGQTPEDEPQTWVHDDPPPQVIEELKAIRANYSMDSEREVHDAMFPGLAAQVEAQPMAATGTDDIFF